MKRRDFVTKALGGGAAVAGLAACGRNAGGPGISTSKTRRLRWNMVTTWPKNFPGLGTGAEYLARIIDEMSDGRLKIRVYGAGERVPAFEVFDAVSRGAAQMGHSAAYYWKGKAPAAVFFAAVPFGFTAQEMNGWLYHGGGMELWRELYADYNLVPFAAGNTGTQMGGWFNVQINSLADLDGLKMRIPGLGGEVMQRIGVTPVTIPGGELFTALQTGTIDATEWVGPWNDLAFGFHKITKHYYYPGWQEPGPTLEAMVNRDAWNELPKDLQAVVEQAAKATNAQMLSGYAAQNQRALQTLVNEHAVLLHPFPDEVLAALRKTSAEVVEEFSAGDPFAAKVYASYKQFHDQVKQSSAISEQAIMNAR